MARTTQFASTQALVADGENELAALDSDQARLSGSVPPVNCGNADTPHRCA